MKTNIKLSSSNLAWHPAFVEALQMELQEYKDVLEFLPEYQLTSEPLKIDCVVIKKTKDAVIKKNIAAIFREYNLLEYKSPGDYVSVADYYKVYGYTCLYAFLTKVPITNMSVSFVESRRPKKLLAHLQKEHKYEIAQNTPGIYTVTGDVLPIQIIDSRKLSPDENLWLRNLNSGLNRSEISKISMEIAKLGKSARIEAYLNIVGQANLKVIKEMLQMKNSLTLEQVFEDVGLTAKWEARGAAMGEAKGRDIGRNEGRAEGKREIAKKLKTMGDSPERIQTITGLSSEDIARL